MDIYAVLKKCVDPRRYPGEPYYLTSGESFEDDLNVFLFDLFVRAGALEYNLKGKSVHLRKDEAIKKAKSFFSNEKYNVMKEIIIRLLEHTKIKNINFLLLLKTIMRN